MLNFKQAKCRFKTPFVSKQLQLTKEINDHPSWKGDVSLCEAAALLKGNNPFTYVLSAGMDKNHFFLSYVDFDLVVKHKNVRIILNQGNWAIKNGSTTIYSSISKLIPDCLHCSANVCKPLV